MSNETVNDCDPEKTLDLIELFQIPQAERDQEWVQDFLEVVPNASLRCLQPQIQHGPDGFPYLILCLPESGEEFDAFSVHHSIPFCLKKGCGIAIFADAKNMTQPEFVFSFGSLWSYDRFGNFIGDPGDEIPAPNEEPPKIDPDKPREVQIGSPSDEYLPPYARTAIARFLKDTIGLEKPRVALIMDPVMKPSRALMFTDLQPERFEKQEQFAQLMTLLRWFLPASRGLMAGVPQLAEHSVPL